MRIPGFVFACIAASVAAQGSSAFGQANPALVPHEDVNNWGKWGDDDEKGAANYVTPESIVAAAKLIQDGDTFSLAIPVEGDGPRFPTRNPPHHFMVSTGQDATRLSPDPNTIAFTDDYIYMALQGSSQWDSLAHAFYGDAFYNGYPLETVGIQGATKLGMEQVRDAFVGRAVLIDIVRYKGASNLPHGYGISREDIEGALEAQGTEVKRGDIVIIRTGMVPAYYTMTAADRAAWPAHQTGINKSVIPWIKEKEISAIAADNLGVEQAPNPDGQDWNLHGNILRDMGVFMGELWWLEELADDCAEDGRYAFFISAPPLHIPGAVGSPVNPIAVK